MMQQTTTRFKESEHAEETSTDNPTMTQHKSIADEQQRVRPYRYPVVKCKLLMYRHNKAVKLCGEECSMHTSCYLHTCAESIFNYRHFLLSAVCSVR